MKTMRCELVQQIVSYREVGTELRDRMDAISDCGYSIKDVIETVASNNAKNKQGFIIIYECDIPDKCEENSDDSEKHDEKPEPNPMIFYTHNRDSAIEFIDKLKKTIDVVGYVTVYQAYVILDRLKDSPYNHYCKATDFNDCLLGWNDLSSMGGADGSYDNWIMEDYYPRYRCSVRLPAPKYLTEK